MNIKDLCIILDPAHGANVKGKCSPDGVHKEYYWSRAIVKKLKEALSLKGYEVHLTTDSLNEPGLTKRKNAANAIPTANVKLLISLHNNAAGNGDNWYHATGVEIWTSKGKTQSDIFSSMMLMRFKKDFPDVKIRTGSSDPTDLDKDENFTVLMGNYQAMLIEWLFMDSRWDIEKLLSPTMDDMLVESIVAGIEEINDYVKLKLKKP